MVQLSHPYMTTGKTIALAIWIFVGKVMSLLFNTLSRFVIAFLSRSRHLLISSGIFPKCSLAYAICHYFGNLSRKIIQSQHLETSTFQRDHSRKQIWPTEKSPSVSATALSISLSLLTWFTKPPCLFGPFPTSSAFSLANPCHLSNSPLLFLLFSC